MRTTAPLLRTLAAWLVVCAAALSGPARADDDTLYLQLGARPGLVTLVDDLMERLLADPRMNPFFRDIDRPHLKEQLVVQLCEVAGGPCHRQGSGMKKAHAGVDISVADFNAMVEVLQASMDAQGIAFGTQNRLLARLAPMHRDIVNVP